MSDMETEKQKAFAVWARGAYRTTHEERAWLDGWVSALEARPLVVETIRQVAKAVECSEIQKRIRGIAVAAFELGHDTEAKHFRELANEIFGKPV